MHTTREQLETYENQGFLFLPEYFSQLEVERMRAELPAIFAEESERKVVEKGGNIVRSVYGAHTTNEIFNRLTRHPRLVELATKIIGSQIYIYQFKINAKVAFGGDLWEWHQDYVFWRNEDGMPAPRVTNVAIFLDEVTEFNGPMFIIPGSHKEGMIDVSPRHTQLSDGAGLAEAYRDSPEWISNLTADLKYSLSKQTVGSLVKKYGLVAPKGQAGSALFFHGNLVHGSTNNISPFDRVVVIISYNSIENTPSGVENPRPGFLVSRDTSPIIPLSEEGLLP